MYIERYILRSNLADGPLNEVVMLIVCIPFIIHLRENNFPLCR